MAKKLEPSPCPYCGSEPGIDLTSYIDGVVWYWVECDLEKEHGCYGPQRRTRLAAINAWNARKVK